MKIVTTTLAYYTAVLITVEKILCSRDSLNLSSNWLSSTRCHGFKTFIFRHRRWRKISWSVWPRTNILEQGKELTARPISQILDSSEEHERDKHSSLFVRSVRDDKGKKSFERFPPKCWSPLIFWKETFLSLFWRRWTKPESLKLKRIFQLFSKIDTSGSGSVKLFYAVIWKT